MVVMVVSGYDPGDDICCIWFLEALGTSVSTLLLKLQCRAVVVASVSCGACDKS